MATDNSDYKRGEMEVTAHKHTFGGFMNWTVYGGSMVALVVIYPTLVFGAKMAWAPALFVTLVVGILLGMGLKLKGGWYAGVIATALFIAVLTMVIGGFAGA